MSTPEISSRDISNISFLPRRPNALWGTDMTWTIFINRWTDPVKIEKIKEETDKNHEDGE